MDRDDAEGFIVDFNRTYDEKTAIPQICERRYYDDDEDAERSFFQIGRRTTVPKSLVDEGRYRYVSDAVVEALCEGEKAFLVDSLAARDDVPVAEAEMSCPLETAEENVNNPTSLLVPRDEGGDRAVAEWEDEGRVRRFGDGAYIVDEEGDANCWLHRHDGEDTVVVDAECVEVVQKKGDGIGVPSRFGYVEEYDDLNKGIPLTVYFGAEEFEGGDRYDGFIEILYRVVLSEPVVEDGGACRLRW